MDTRRDFLTAAAAFAAGSLVFAEDAEAGGQPVTLLNGNGVPGIRLGVVGDFYIDDRAHSIYGPKRTHGWGKPTSLIGPKGAAGSDGAAGTGILHGGGAPAKDLGADGDFYIDTATTQLYGPRDGGVWGSPVSLTGAANVASISGGTL